MAESVAKLRATSKEYIVAATRPTDRSLTCLELARRSQWLEQGQGLMRIADDLENDCLTYNLDQTEGQEEARTKELLKGILDG